MKITVSLFASARETAGADQVEVEVAEPATVSELKRSLVASYPALEPLVKRSMFSVDQEYASDGQELVASADVALIPPVSGG